MKITPRWPKNFWERYFEWHGDPMKEREGVEWKTFIRQQQKCSCLDMEASQKKFSG